MTKCVATAVMTISGSSGRSRDTVWSMTSSSGLGANLAHIAWADSSMTEVLSEYDTPVAGDRAVTSALGTETMNHGTKTAFANLCRHQAGWRTSKLSLMLGTQAKAPQETGALPKIQPVRASGSDLGRLDVQDFAGTRDRDRPRLHRLRDLAHEVDV